MTALGCTNFNLNCDGGCNNNVIKGTLTGNVYVWCGYSACSDMRIGEPHGTGGGHLVAGGNIQLVAAGGSNNANFRNLRMYVTSEGVGSEVRITCVYQTCDNMQIVAMVPAGSFYLIDNGGQGLDDPKLAVLARDYVRVYYGYTAGNR